MYSTHILQVVFVLPPDLVVRARLDFLRAGGLPVREHSGSRYEKERGPGHGSVSMFWTKYFTHVKANVHDKGLELK